MLERYHEVVNANITDIIRRILIVESYKTMIKD
jgi:hypothetical protein